MIAKEGSCILKVEQKKIVSKAMDVFYNPIMKLNRDIAILLLKSWKKNNLRIADIMTGSGVRTIRFLQELPSKKIKEIWCNDISKKACDSTKEQLKLNKISLKKLETSCEEATIGLLKRKGFDYIEIDPFGTPNPYLDAAIKRLSREGILAVTATDTSALTGTYLKACQKKYWALPLKNFFMHETSLRILIRKIQLIGIQYEKPLLPVFCHASNHYVRLYLKLEKSKTKVDEIIRKHKYLLWNPDTFEIATSDFPEKDWKIAGPVWTGELYDKRFVKKMQKEAEKTDFKEAQKLLELINEEIKVNMLGSYDLHKISKKIKKSVPRVDMIIEQIKKKGHKAVRTHTNLTGIKTTLTSDELFQLLLSQE